MSSILHDLTAFFLHNRIPVFGVAHAEALESRPEGYRPADVLQEAKSVLCIGLPIAKGIFDSTHHMEGTYWRAANVSYRHIDSMLTTAASIIEATGEMAVPVYGCFPYAIVGHADFRGHMSLVYLGQACGLGKIGKNGLLFNRTYGPRLLLGGIVTTAELEPLTWPGKDEFGCPEDCFECQTLCPAKAIDREGRVDGPVCTRHSTKSVLFSHVMKADKPAPEDLHMVNHLTAIDDHSWYTCTKCVSACPHK